ncbi:MAG: isoprenylcysteine carboxylmethyltransferase family protein [Deltaproteobacteria bacterium]|nr:isoprenylcysteine carboxylmethyltransferase family protein [Deltaproteobacteria bacterium]
MKEKMSIWGVGPIFAFLSIGYGVTVLAISHYFDPTFRIPLIPKRLLSGLGVVLLLIGIPFFILSVKSVMKAYNSDLLVTRGVYGCCRHPLYSAWVVFIVPGIVLLVNSWIGLTVPLFMFFLLRRLVIKEETYLERVFDSEYKDYKKEIPCILPFGYIKRLYHKADSADAKKPRG